MASQGYVVGERFGEGVPTGRTRSPMLSTDGTYLSTDDGGAVHVQRTSDASVVTPRVPPSYDRALAYGWADDDDLLVVALRDPLDLQRAADLVFLTCSVSAGSCEETGEGHAFLATFNLPVGQPAGSAGNSLGPR